MGFEVNKWIISILTVGLELASLTGGEGFRKVPCYFIFGDSLADNGNNNNLQTYAKADYEPYGIDFPFGPTGRFTNGRTTVDFIAELLGFSKYIPPYATVASSVDILFGVNYASGAAGILNETGQQLGERIAFDMQLENHRKVVVRLAKMLILEKAAKWYLGKCLYTVELGNNDYINNYFLPQYYNTSQQYTLHQFTQLLIQQYTQQIQASDGSVKLTPERLAKGQYTLSLSSNKFWLKPGIDPSEKVNYDHQITRSSIVFELNEKLIKN